MTVVFLGKVPSATGWVRRAAFTEPRLSEVVAAYEEAGFEVKVEEPAQDRSPPGCAGCAVLDGAKVVFTRPRIR